MNRYSRSGWRVSTGLCLAMSVAALLIPLQAQAFTMATPNPNAPITTPPAQSPTLPDGTTNPNYVPPNNSSSNPFARITTGNRDIDYYLGAYNSGTTFSGDAAAIAQQAMTGTFDPATGTFTPGSSQGCQSAASSMGLPAGFSDNLAQAIAQNTEVGKYFTPELIEDLKRNGLTPAVRMALQQAGIDPSIINDPKRLAQRFGLNPSDIVGDLVDELTPEELAEMEDILDTLSSLEDLDGLDLGKIEDTMRLMNTLKGLPGFDALSNSEISGIMSGFAQMKSALDMDDQQLDAIFRAGTTLTHNLGIDINVSELSMIVDSYSQLERSTSAADALDRLDLNNIDNFMPGQSVTESSRVLSQIQAIPGMENKDMAQASRDLQGLPEEQLANIFLGPGNFTPGALTPEEKQKINRNMASMTHMQGVNVRDASSLFSGFQALGQVSGLNNRGLADKAKTLQNAKAMKAIQGVDIAKFSGVMNSLHKIPGMEKLDGKHLKSYHDKMKEFMDLPGLPKIPGEFGSEKIDLDKLSKVFDAIKKVEKLKARGEEYLTKNLEKLNRMGKKEMEKLMGRFKNLDRGKLGKLLERGWEKANQYLNRIPGAQHVNNALGRYNNFTSVLGSVSFSSAGCLFGSLLNLAMNCPMPTGGNSAAGGDNALSGPGKDDSGNVCLKGSITPVEDPAESDGSEEAEESEDSSEEAQSAAPDGGVSGVKPPACMPNKNTAVASTLDFNGKWLWQEMIPGSKTLLRGFGGEVHRTDAMVSGLGGQAAFGCKGKLQTTNRCSLSAEVGNPVFNRLVMDGCTNEYVLNNAWKPEFIFDKKGARKGYDQRFCQPLKGVAVEKVEDVLDRRHGQLEYDAWKYIMLAWNKVLVEPYMDGKVKMGGSYEKLTEPKKEVTLDDIMQHPYERIFDPTHPFSPRWDHIGSERMIYSPMTGPGYAEFSTCSVRCSAVPVDIMSWRSEVFAKRMGCRIGINTACFWTDVMINALLNPQCGCIPPFNLPCKPPNIPCGFNLVASGNTFMGACWVPLYHQQQTPPCTTKYDEADKNTFLKPACEECGKINKICQYLAKPVPMINHIKLRTMTDAKPEGYTFQEFFGRNRPYMRWWDTGTEAGASGQSEIDLDSMLGSRDAIVGIGIEGSSCRYGGGKGKPQPCRGGGSINVPNPDPLTSWMELKLYQSRTMREYQMNCFGQYEKLWKFGGEEDNVLTLAGGELRVTERPGEKNLITWPQPWRGYVSDPKQGKRFPMLFARQNTQGAIRTGLDNVRRGDIIIWDQQSSPNIMPKVAYVTEACNALAKSDKTCVEPSNNDLDWIKVKEFNAGKYPDACGITNAWQLGPEHTLYKDKRTAPNDTLQKSLPRHTLWELSPRLLDPNSDVPGQRFFTVTCDDVNMSSCIETKWNSLKFYRICLDSREGDRTCPDSPAAPSGGILPNILPPVSR